MQIVIDIPDDEYNAICSGTFDTDGYFKMNLSDAFTNGTPIPKGHGDLVDRDVINERFYSIYNDAMNCSNQPSDKYLLNNWSMCLDTAPTVIEADKEGKE